MSDTETPDSETPAAENPGGENEAAQTASKAEAHHDEHPNYVKIWGILVVLLVISVAGPFLEIQVVTLITAFGIAIVKAYMVARNFMHVNIEPRFVAYVLLTMLVCILLFFAGTAPDVMNHTGQHWTNVAAQAAVARAQGGAEVPEGPFVASDKFGQVCAVCHGATGHGDGTAAAGLDPTPANFSDPAFWETRDLDHVIQVIDQGGAAVGRSALMPAFGSQFSEEQVRELAEFVVSLGPAEAVEPEPAEDPQELGTDSEEATGDESAPGEAGADPSSADDNAAGAGEGEVGVAP